MKAFEFDEIFERYRSQSKLPELFDAIIEVLKKIRDSDAVDSKSMLDALNKIIATLRINIKGSYFSTHSAWKLLLAFCKNYAVIELKKLPAIGSMVEALEKTVQECDQEFVKLQEDIKEEIKNVVEHDLKGMHNKMDFLLAYDDSAALISDFDISVIRDNA